VRCVRDFRPSASLANRRNNRFRYSSRPTRGRDAIGTGRLISSALAPNSTSMPKKAQNSAAVSTGPVAKYGVHTASNRGDAH
jgi:hypothetical protein